MDLPRTAGHLGAALLLACSSKIEAAAPLAAADPPRIVVRVDNLVGVPSDDLQFAEGRAAEVFARIGVRIRWIDQEESISDHVTASFTVLLINEQGEETSRLIDALGVAHPSVRRAYVLCNRIAALHVGPPRTLPTLLGDVIAHELGHLLLHPPGHSPDGIMRAGLDTKSWYIKTFTRPQAREVLSRVRALR